MAKLTITVVVLIALPLVARARLCPAKCLCNWERDPVRAMAGADIVIDGTVLDTLELDPTTSAPTGKALPPLPLYRSHVLIDRVWKGAVPDTLPVFTFEPGGSCGFGFDRGQAYLLFLHRGDDGRFVATSCSLSRPIERADSIIRALGPVLRRRAA